VYREPAVKEVKDGEDDDGAGIGGMEDGWQDESFEDAFPERVREVSVGEGALAGWTPRFETEDNGAKLVDPG